MKQVEINDLRLSCLKLAIQVPGIGWLTQEDKDNKKELSTESIVETANKFYDFVSKVN